jgi:hypothetical protein
VQLFGPLERAAGIVAIGHRLADRRDLFVRGQLAVRRMIDAELRFDLAQLAFRPIERELELLRLDAHEDVAGADLSAELDGNFVHAAGHFTADLRHVRRQERPGQIDLPLNRHPLDVRGLHRDRAAAAPAPASTAAAATTRAAASPAVF